MNSETQQTGTLERPVDAGPGEAGEVSRWLMELELADKVEKDWRDSAAKVIDRYRDEGNRSDWKFNILWSNVEVMRPNLYGQTPKADVRPRHSDGNKVNAVAAELMERALNFTIESEDFDSPMQAVILDYLLPGRAVSRVRFEPVIEDDVMTYARVKTVRWPYDRFRRGPGTVWDEVPWVAYAHHLTREEADRDFPDAQVNFDVVMDGVDKEKADENPSVFKRILVWEIHDKNNREVLFLAPSSKDRFLKREPDPLELDGFFDCARPLYAVESGTSLVPIAEYQMYRDQARELDRVTMRINRLIGALKVRGIYDSTITEFKDLLTSGDNEMIPTSSAGPAMAAGGLDKGIWMMPVEQVIKVIRELQIQREAIKQTIYEIMGIGDILRGSSNPNETLGAQQLKAQTGSMRMQRRQRDVQRLVRDLLRKTAELIGQNYTPELLSLMTGIQLPTAEQKQATAMQAQMQAQATGQQPQPDTTPTWDEVMQVLRSDLLRTFNIDIETDSTIAADQASERQQVTELIAGVGGFVQQMGPAVQGGLLSMEAAKALLAAAIRPFKLGRLVEDAIERDATQPQQPTPEQQAQQQAQMQLQAAEIESKKAKAMLDSAKAQKEMSEINAPQQPVDPSIPSPEMLAEAAKLRRRRKSSASV